MVCGVDTGLVEIEESISEFEQSVLSGLNAVAKFQTCDGVV